MKIKVPTKIDLNGFLVEVRYFNLLKDNERLCGEFKAPNIIEIAIAEHATKSELLSTIKHELFHAVFCRTGIHHMFPSDMEEGVVRALENHLCKTLKFDTKSWVDTQFIDLRKDKEH